MPYSAGLPSLTGMNTIKTILAKQEPQHLLSLHTRLITCIQPERPANQLTSWHLGRAAGYHSRGKKQLKPSKGQFSASSQDQCKAFPKKEHDLYHIVLPNKLIHSHDLRREQMGKFLPDYSKTLTLKNEVEFITDGATRASMTFPLIPWYRIVTTCEEK